MKHVRSICRLVVLWMISTTSLIAQGLFRHPEAGTPFDSESLPVIAIECGEALEWMFNEPNWYSNIEHPASFSFTSINGTESIETVGVRLRGNTSRAANKKSFKIAFNAFDEAGEWQGLKKLNLNGEHNDPSVMRARLVWECFRDAGVPVSRSAHVQLYINGTYFGVYSTAEQLDGNWLDERFPYGHGNLWKCTYPADLAFLDTNPEAYKLTPPWSEQRIYELKTNEAQDDYSALARFIDILNNASDDELACKLESVFDVEAYLKVLAGEILVGHWDNYVGNKNNFYLYERSFDGRLMYLPYDADNTLGIQWFGEWTTQDPYNWTNSTNRPLYTRILAQDQYRQRFSWYLHWWMDNYQNPAWIEPRTDWLQSLLATGIETDDFYGLDYGFTSEDFEASNSESWGNHVAHAIGPFVASRNFWADAQSEEFEGVPSSTPFAWAKGPILDDTLRIMVWGHELDNALSWNATAHVLLSNGSTVTEPMTLSPSELHGSLWSANIPADGNDYAHWHAIIESPSGFVTQSPCSSEKIWNTLPQPGIVINEVMSKNNSWVADAAGDYQDWAELYNQSDGPINVSDLYLTNRWSEPNRWKLPNVTLDSGQHLLVWCDDESDEGTLHASFTLDASDDELFLMSREDNAWRLMDSISWTNSAADQSLGRATDGAPNWIWFQPLSDAPPTPNASNGTVNSIVEHSPVNEANIAWQTFELQYAVSIQKPTLLPFPAKWSIFSMEGKAMAQGKGRDLNLNHLSAGLFILRFHDEHNNIHGACRFIHQNL